MSLRTRSALLLLAALALPACTIEIDDAALDEVEFRDTWSCTTCGLNSADANDFPIPELHIDGAPNSAGVKVLDVVGPERAGYSLKLVGDDLCAVESTRFVACKEDLIGWKIIVERDGQPVQLHIKATGTDASWAGAAVAPITTYAISFTDPVYPDIEYNVCKAFATDPDHPAVTLIADETYDRTEIASMPGKIGWFTLACKDEAVYKMKLMNYGPNQDFDGQGHPATVDQRDATLKMLTADYLGTGHSFTQNGTPLLWRNLGETVFTNPALDGEIEARWGPHGALCLSTPRLADYLDVEEVATQLERELPLACDSQATAVYDWEWITYKPLLP